MHLSGVAISLCLVYTVTMIELLVFILSVAVSLFVGAFVVFRNPRRAVNQVYGLLTLAFVTFGVANYLSITMTDQMLVYVRMTVFATTIMTTALYFLVLLLQSNRKSILSNTFNRFIIIGTIIVAGMDLSPLVFSDVSYAGLSPVPTPAAGVAAFLLHFILVVIAGLYTLFKGALGSKGEIRAQYTYILIGMMPTLFLAPLTGILLPVFFQRTEYIFLNPLYVAFFVIMIGYAMIRHKLFDIKYAAIRTAVYICVLTTLVIIYYFVAY